MARIPCPIGQRAAYGLGMASVSWTAYGAAHVRFATLDGHRRCVSLGKVSERAALLAKRRIEELLTAQSQNRGWSKSLQNWVYDIDAELYQKLMRAGLVPTRLVRFGHQRRANRSVSRPDVPTTGSETPSARKLVWCSCGGNVNCFRCGGRGILQPGDPDCGNFGSGMSRGSLRAGKRRGVRANRSQTRTPCPEVDGKPGEMASIVGTDPVDRRGAARSKYRGSRDPYWPISGESQSKKGPTVLRRRGLLLCSECGRSFSSWREFVRHISSQHRSASR